MAAPVIVVGGGIAGLAIAREIRRRDGSVLLLEASDRLGGYVRSELVDGALVEHGPQGFLGERPGVLDVIEELGLSESLLPAADAASRRYILRDGRLLALPMSPPAFLLSPLLSPGGRLRVLAEPWAKSAPNRPESVHEFAARRIGREAADVLVDAMVTGIFAGDPKALSVEACFPKMPAMEREYGGLFRALRAKKKAGASAFGKRLHSFRGGMEDLVRALKSELNGCVRTGAPIDEIGRGGAAWEVRLGGGERIDAASLVVAAPARAAAGWLDAIDADLGPLLREVRSAPVAVVGLVLSREQVEHPLDGYGFLVPGGRFPILGCLFESTVFPGRAPAGNVLLRVMVGGSRNPEAALRPPEAVVESAVAALQPILGIEGEPVATRCVVHADAIPQYDVGHPARLRRIETNLAALPGLQLAGASYRGVSVNSLVGEAGAVAERALGRG